MGIQGDGSSGPESRQPPLNLSREAYGYLVISAGVGLTVAVLFSVPGDIAYARPVRIGLALGIAAVTGYVYQYVTNTWYDQFEGR